MKLALHMLLSAKPALQKLAQTKMKIGPSFWLARVTRSLTSELDTYEQQKDELVRQHGQEEQGRLSVAPGMPGWPAFAAEMSELLAQEVEAAIEPRPVTFLGEIDVEPAVLADLHFLFHDE